MLLTYSILKNTTSVQTFIYIGTNYQITVLGLITNKTDKIYYSIRCIDKMHASVKYSFALIKTKYELANNVCMLPSLKHKSIPAFLHLCHRQPAYRHVHVCEIQLLSKMTDVRLYRK